MYVTPMVDLTDGRFCWTYFYTSIIECRWLCPSSTNGSCRSRFITDGTRFSPSSIEYTCLCPCIIGGSRLCTSSTDATCLFTSHVDSPCQFSSTDGTYLSISRLDGSYPYQCDFVIDGISLGTSGADGQLSQPNLQL
jgi:hypothetical protein